MVIYITRRHNDRSFAEVFSAAYWNQQENSIVSPELHAAGIRSAFRPTILLRHNTRPLLSRRFTRYISFQKAEDQGENPFATPRFRWVPPGPLFRKLLNFWCEQAGRPPTTNWYISKLVGRSMAAGIFREPLADVMKTNPEGC